MKLTSGKRIVDKQFILCLLISLVTASLSFGYFIMKGHGAFTVWADFNSQQLTFAAAIQTALKEQAAGEWCWNLDLGTSLINGFSFYDLGSIFYWISFLFPKAWFPYIIGELYILKYVVASLTAYLYLKIFVKNRNYAVIGALLYAFSGFQTTNLMFYHFHDVVAFFPLLLLGLEYMFDPNSSPKYRGGYIYFICLSELPYKLFFLCSGSRFSYPLLRYPLLERFDKKIVAGCASLYVVRHTWDGDGLHSVFAEYHLCLGQYPQQHFVLSLSTGL